MSKVEQWLEHPDFLNVVDPDAGMRQKCWLWQQTCSLSVIICVKSYLGNLLQQLTGHLSHTIICSF